MFHIDPQFRQMGQDARQRQRLRLLRWALALALLSGLSLASWLILRGAGHDRSHPADEDRRVTLVEPEDAIAPIPRHDPFTDLPGDPILIARDDPRQSAGPQLPRPPQLQRDGAAAKGPLVLLQTEIHQPHRQMVANLPTTREEFALFQAQRGPGGTLASPDLAQGTAETSAQWVRTRESASRRMLWQDLVLQTGQAADVSSLLEGHGFAPDIASRVAARLRDQLQLDSKLPATSLLALRYRMDGAARQVLQLSLYRQGEYRGSLAMADSGQLVAAADAWADQPLLQQSGSMTGLEADFQPRLLDAIYSAALRQGLPSTLIGEAIAMMARVHDLDGFASAGDRLDLIYDPEWQDKGDSAGQILFIGLTGPGGTRHCYVIPDPRQGFRCHAPDARLAAGGPRTLLQTPVSGILRQRFAATIGEGRVIWDAPPGTPVRAVAPGHILSIEEQGLDVTITIAHENGLTSRYQALHDIPSAIRPAATIQQGQQIGRISASAGDKGLVFQLLKDGTAVDPMPYLIGGQEILASGAVESLIGRIIHVESGGDAAAKNPLSTATGLGQFIESTWLRMMRTYRADLVALLDRDGLLRLRLDPELSRQMLRHLAQENESYLRVQGHAPTAGNLYLAHFLGAQGAGVVLSSDPSLPVENVLSSGVIAANPFLRGYTIAALKSWADRKMGQAAVIAATSAPDRNPDPTPPEIMPFVEAVDQILAAASQ